MRSSGVPEEAATFHTKSQLALELLTELMAEGLLPARWVTCDEGYGLSNSWTGWPRWIWATCRECRSTRGSGWSTPTSPSGRWSRPAAACRAPWSD